VEQQENQHVELDTHVALTTLAQQLAVQTKAQAVAVHIFIHCRHNSFRGSPLSQAPGVP